MNCRRDANEEEAEFRHLEENLPGRDPGSLSRQKGKGDQPESSREVESKGSAGIDEVLRRRNASPGARDEHRWKEGSL